MDPGVSERIGRAVEAGKHREALVELIVLWNETRSPEIADLVDRVGGCVGSDKARQLARTTDADELDRLWNTLAKRLDLADVAALLAAWPKGSYVDFEQRYAAIARWPDDPRVAMALATMLHLAPHKTPAGVDVYRDFTDNLVRLHDARTVPVLRALAEAIADEDDDRARHTARGAIAELGTRIADRLDEELARSPPQPVDPAWFAQLDALLPAAPPPLVTLRARRKKTTLVADDLLRAIYESPDDDALRLVYADALEELGDPRAELITLQFKEVAGRARPSDTRRINALLKKHHVRWMGALGKRLTTAGVTFEKGFLSGMALAPVVRGSDWDGDAPELSTVRTLVLVQSVFELPMEESLLRAIGMSRRLGALRELHVTGVRLLDQSMALADAPAFARLERFGYVADNPGRAEVAGILAAFPHLTGLRLRWTLVPEIERIHAVIAACDERLIELDLELVARQTFLVLAVLERLATLHPTVVRVGVASGPELWSVERRAGEARWRASVRAGNAAFDPARVRAVIDALPANVPLDRDVTLPAKRGR